MKKAVLILAMLFGCGTPCDDQLTENELDITLTLYEVARDQGVPSSEILLGSVLNCPFDLECRECVAWIVEQVYGL